MSAQEIEAPVVNLHAIKHLAANPIAARKVQLVTRRRNDAIRALAGLELVTMFAQIDKERRGGVSAGSTGDVVSGSRTPSIPVTVIGEKRDESGRVVVKGAVATKDARDRELDAYERAVEKHLDVVLKAVQSIRGIQAEVGATHAPSKREREQASDIGTDCKNCARPVACTPADRLRGGRCSACAQYWTAHACEEERPKELWA